MSPSVNPSQKKIFSKNDNFLDDAWIFWQYFLMNDHPSSLSDQFARLRDSARAGEEKCARIPASIHALIMACLARIFARLEQFFLLWQSGQLPPPQAHATQHPISRRDSARRSQAPRRVVDSADPPVSQPAAQLARSPSRAPRIRHPRSASASPPGIATPRPRPAHDPPHARPAGTPLRPSRSTAPILLRYRNKNHPCASNQTPCPR